MCRTIDVNDLQSFIDAIDEAEEAYGPVDCIVNNAGIMLLGNIEQQADAEWRKMFETNVLGLLNGISIVLESMKKNQRGTIINISSLAGRKTYEHHAAYSGTKFAVHGISETVRWEMAPYNIRVITIAPGAAETELLDHISSESIVDEYRQWKSDIGGVMSAEEVAKSVIFAYSLPQSVCVRELVIAPTRQQN
ncbi:NADP-dependent 3-hydroxy acid dehydrogenase YdfG [Erwinia toletana]|uniref:NADP-dependent 3-hydroxy acid dehydrogenase YdfG n=1 Tax=Winslowiella toletana TaxID=92490 RepID=A0ABS4PEG9_9GAMM|nr:SDR family oxidoreductase [Winslowiella toletana]MBP2170501.1 NADP-dependent 3-hydroxy acid dehydrogenase YdfG [Winslowiella toletana]